MNKKGFKIMENIDYHKLWFECRELSYERTAERYLRESIDIENISKKDFLNLISDLVFNMNNILLEN